MHTRSTDRTTRSQPTKTRIIGKKPPRLLPGHASTAQISNFNFQTSNFKSQLSNFEVQNSDYKFQISSNLQIWTGCVFQPHGVTWVCFAHVWSVPIFPHVFSACKRLKMDNLHTRTHACQALVSCRSVVVCTGPFLGSCTHKMNTYAPHTHTCTNTKARAHTHKHIHTKARTRTRTGYSKKSSTQHWI